MITIAQSTAHPPPISSILRDPRVEYRDDASHDDLDGYFWKCESIEWVLVIKGYFDETFDGHDRCTWVAGYLGDESAWVRYVSDWHVGLGARKSLHLNSLRWKKPSTRILLETLAPIPRASGLIPLVGGSRTDDFADIVHDTRLDHHSNGYIVSLIEVVTKAILRIPDGEHLEVVFEDRDQTRERAEDTLLAMRLMAHFADTDPQFSNSDGSSKLTKYGFQAKGNTVLFDQADYLCYALLQRYRDPKSVKAVWTSPILANSGVVGNGLMDRELARIAFQRALEGIKARRIKPEMYVQPNPKQAR